MTFKKFIQKLFLFDKFEIKTKASPHTVARNINFFADPKRTNYYGRADENGFFLGQKHQTYNGVVHVKNSFAPVAKGKIVRVGEDETEVSVTVRMHAAVLVLFMPMYIASLITLILFPLVYLMVHLAFSKPAKRLKEIVTDLVSDGMPHSYHEEDGA